MYFWGWLFKAGLAPCMSACLFISKLQRRKLLLIQKKYFQIYKQVVGKFALNFRFKLIQLSVRRFLQKNENRPEKTE
jgi:hypothetical protein